MQLEKTQKEIKDLERLIKVFENLQKQKTGQIIDTLLKYGKLEINNTFNGLVILFYPHSKTFKNGNKGINMNIATYKKHENKIDNKIYPLLLCMIKDINSNFKKTLKNDTIKKEETQN